MSKKSDKLVADLRAEIQRLTHELSLAQAQVRILSDFIRHNPTMLGGAKA